MSELHTQPSMTMQLMSWRGYSAYEIALKNGFEGTESEWLESLRGEDGASATELTVNNRSAVDGNITLRAGDIYVQPGLDKTVAQALEGALSAELVEDSLESQEASRVLSARQGMLLGNMVSAKAQAITASVILSADAWTQDGDLFSQTVSLQGVTADVNRTAVFVSPATDRTMEQDYLDCEVRASAQGDDTLIFTCTAHPQSNLEAAVTVLILGVRA